MLTEGFGEKCVSSTSGVLPIRSTSEDATPLRTTLPRVDRWAQLAEQLVDAAGEAARCGVDGVVPVPLHEPRVPTVQPRQLEQVLPDVPRAVFQHPLAPLGAEPLDRAQD